MVFISDGKLHDVCFVELYNAKLHEHYTNDGLNMERDAEFNDGCASQFSALTRRKVKTFRIFTETSHGRSESDGLGGVVKCYASRSECDKKTAICNAFKLFQFYEENLNVGDAFEGEKPILNRLFFTCPKMILKHSDRHFQIVIII